MNDWDLLQDYVAHGSEIAFGQLMDRHLDLVYSTALRWLGNAHAAEDVAQSVFCLLATKAGSLPSGTLIVGWLYQTAFFVASRQRQSEDRRRHREQEAAYMQSRDIHGNEAPVSWEQIEPVLDQAMHQLNDQERAALLLRYFQGKPLQEVGAALGVSEDAARMRVNRSLEKLREMLLKKNAVCPALALGTLLTQNAVQAAPTLAVRAIRAAVLLRILPAGIPKVSTERTWMQKHPLTTILGVVTGLVFLATSAFYLYNQYQARHLPPGLEPARPALRPADIRAAAVRAPGQRAAGYPRSHLPAAAATESTGEETAPAQVRLEAKLIEVSQVNTKALGVDWYLGQTLQPSGPLSGQAATAANPSGLSPGVVGAAPGSANPVGVFPGASGGAEGVQEIPPNSSQALNGVSNSMIAHVFDASATPTGILTEVQFATVLRALEQREGTSILTLPTVTTLSGRQAQIQGPIQPAASAAPAAPATVSPESSKETAGAGTVTPEDLKIMLDFIPEVLADGKTMKLTLFVTLGRPLSSSTVATVSDPSRFQLDSLVQVPPGAVVASPVPLPSMVVTRQITNTVTLTDGHTLLIMGLTPPTGPEPGPAQVRRQRLIAVTPTVVDPAGNRVNPPE